MLFTPSASSNEITLASKSPLIPIVPILFSLKLFSFTCQISIPEPGNPKS